MNVRSRPTLLVVEHGDRLLARVTDTLEDAGYHAVGVPGLEEAVHVMSLLPQLDALVVGQLPYGERHRLETALRSRHPYALLIGSSGQSEMLERVEQAFAVNVH